jgi:hypothetical protein
MKALPILVLTLAVSAAGCGSDSPTPPTNNPPNTPPPGSTTTPTEFRLDLRTNNERPAITGPEAAATGTAVITIRITRDANNTITAATADFNVQMQGFPAGSVITAAHIHPGDANSTGGILWNTGLASGEAALTNGAGSFTKTAAFPGTGDINQAAAIVANPAGFYFNVHSQANGPGVLRAQMNNTGAPADPGEPKPCDPTDPYCVPGQTR